MYRGGIAEKEGLQRFEDLRRAWQERGGGVFEAGWGVDSPMHTM